MRMPFALVGLLACIILTAQRPKGPYVPFPNSNAEDPTGKVIAQPVNPLNPLQPPVRPVEISGVFSHDFLALPGKDGDRCAAQEFFLEGAVPGMSGLIAAAPALPTGVNVQQIKVSGLDFISIELCSGLKDPYDPKPLTFSVSLSDLIR